FFAVAFFAVAFFAFAFFAFAFFAVAFFAFAFFGAVFLAGMVRLPFNADLVISSLRNLNLEGTWSCDH
ncbi:MAG: hypothetical protein ABJB55_10755, partial [Actinomycetota bacterium]